jgi:hypothetical protein
MINEEDTISDDSIELFIDHAELKEYEAEAAKLEVTLDYYLAEFV